MARHENNANSAVDPVIRAINIREVAEELQYRQTLPWNSGRIAEDNSFPETGKLFALINSGIEPLPYMYKGDLFRIHTKHTVIASAINPNRERIIGRVWSDDSCGALSYPEYNGMLVAFSKTFNFADRTFYKVCPSDTANIFHFNTKSAYGIDIYGFYDYYSIGADERYRKEQEVLFPFSKEYLVKAYLCSPNRFNYFMRGRKS